MERILIVTLQERVQKQNGRKRTISRRARSFSTVANRARGYTHNSRNTKRAVSRHLRDPSETRSGHQFSPCCHSRTQIFRLIRRISIYPIYMFAVPDVETTAANRPVEHNSVGTLFFFSFFLFAIILRSPLVRSINVYDVAQSRSSFFLESLHDYSLRITSLLKLFPIRKVPSSRPTTEETSLLICYIGSGAFARICRLANARIFLSHHPPSCF